MTTLRSYFLEDLKVGMGESISKTVTDQVIREFAHVSGDVNPVHLDQAYAATTRFKERIAHGMLGASLISAVIGTKLPGPGAVYLGQNLKFRAPVVIGDTITARVEVAAIDHEKGRVNLGTTCWVGDKLVIEGEALVLVPARG